jgi:hypothetical protein
VTESRQNPLASSRSGAPIAKTQAGSNTVRRTGACSITSVQHSGVHGELEIAPAFVVMRLIEGQPFDQWSADSIRRGMRDR